jgi:hypothetical protein
LWGIGLIGHLSEEAPNNPSSKHKTNTTALSQRLDGQVVVWNTRYQDAHTEFVSQSTKRAIEGKRSDLKSINKQAECFFNRISEDPCLVAFEIMTSDDQVRVSSARIVSSSAATKFNEPLFAVQSDHFFFSRRRTEYFRNATPFYLQFHALKRLAERTDLEGVHILALLIQFREIVCDSAPIAVLMNHAVGAGLIPSWMHFPIPAGDGVLLCRFGESPTTMGFQEDCFLISKHGLTFPPLGSKFQRTFIQANTFLTHDMLRKNQRSVIESLHEAINPVMEETTHLGPLLYGIGPTLLSDSEQNLLTSITTAVCQKIDPTKFNAAF